MQFSRANVFKVRNFTCYFATEDAGLVMRRVGQVPLRSIRSIGPAKEVRGKDELASRKGMR